MDLKHRENILRSIDGDPRLVDLAFQLDRFVHSPRMFEYLVKEKITGPKLYDFYVQMFSCSWLELGKWIVMKVNKENKTRSVIFGKDYLLK